MIVLLTPAEAADLLNVSTGTLANWRHSGKAPAYTYVNGAVRYDQADLLAWLDAHKVEARR